MVMRQVKLHFTLVGKTREWSRNLPSGINLEWTNKDSLDFVKETVVSYFGNRALVVMHEDTITGHINYPEFYAAGWFIDVDVESEMVVVSHGNTMKSAVSNMIESVKSLDWDKLSITINKVVL